jgi:hypothetical protein
LSSELRVIILSALVFSCGGVLLSYISEEVIAESVEGPSVNQTQAVESAGETYIVTLKDQNSSEDRDDIIKSVEEKGGVITHVYSESINGFSVQIPMEKKTEIMYSLVTDMRVETIEPDQTMTLPTTPS